jgi:hypothetical protein
MGMQKLPVIGTFFQNQIAVAGQTGTNALTGAVVAPAACEVTISRFKLATSAGAIVSDGVNATVTLASHLNTIVGQQVTFSGITGALAQLNNQTFTIGSIPTNGTYTFPCSIVGTSGGSPIQEPVFTLPQGFNFVRCDANTVVEYNSDNTYNTASGSATAPTWKVLITGNATPVINVVPSDGFSVRLRCSGITASSFFNNVN